MRVPDITAKKFLGCQALLEPLLTQALTSVIVALREVKTLSSFCCNDITEEGFSKT